MNLIWKNFNLEQPTPLPWTLFLSFILRLFEKLHTFTIIIFEGDFVTNISFVFIMQSLFKYIIVLVQIAIQSRLLHKSRSKIEKHDILYFYIYCWLIRDSKYEKMSLSNFEEIVPTKKWMTIIYFNFLIIIFKYWWEKTFRGIFRQYLVGFDILKYGLLLII